MWAPFARESEYFAPSEKPFMIDFRVADLDALIRALEAEGVPLAGELQEGEFGRFAWILDPEGHKVELWEPPAPGRNPNPEPGKP